MYLAIYRCSDGVEMADPEQHIYLCTIHVRSMMGNLAKMYPPRGKGLITEFVFSYCGYVIVCKQCMSV